MVADYLLGHSRETWGNMSDADIRSNEEHLTRLRNEKNSMKADIVDRKDSIENQTKILESFQNTILGVVSTKHAVLAVQRGRKINLD